MKQQEILFDAGGFDCSHMMRPRAQIRDIQDSLCAVAESALLAEFMSWLLLNIEVLQGLIGPQEAFDGLDDVFKKDAVNDCTDVLEEMI